tara:strand:+ start:861 stop:1292 length:432 start_codon:yes stop_codon:yes gene_type:complete
MSKNKERFEEISETRKRVFIMNKLDTVVGNLYTFHYTSETANDPDPTILVVYRSSGDRLFSANTGDVYFAGINLNHLDKGQSKALLNDYGGKRRITGSMVRRLNKTYKSAYRIYNQGNVEDFSLLDKDIYLEELNDTQEVPKR